MTTGPSATGFPMNMVGVIANSFVGEPGIDKIVQRRLRVNDPNGILAVFPDVAKPMDWEIGGGDNLSPALTRYWIGLHYMTKVAGDNPLGVSQAANMAKIITTGLYRDTALGVALRACSETKDSVTERVLRWKVEESKFFDSLMGNAFVFISTTRLWVETQTA